MRAIAATVLFLLLAGCAALETVEKSPMVAQLTVQQATLRVIDTDPDKADRVLEIAEQTRGMIEVDEVTVGLLDQFLRAQIKWEKLTLADEQLLVMLLDQLRDRLAERMGDGLLSPEDRISIKRVIGWVEDSAKLAQARLR